MTLYNAKVGTPYRSNAIYMSCATSGGICYASDNLDKKHLFTRSTMLNSHLPSIASQPSVHEVNEHQEGKTIESCPLPTISYAHSLHRGQCAKGIVGREPD